MGCIINSDLWECDLCGFIEVWDDFDDIHGGMWVCPVCNTTFCSKCFKDKCGITSWTRMLLDDGALLCPACYKKRKKDVSK